ncbi:ATP-dependent bile acid permease [Penicillium chermesinum]|uniref:ATP-dependent bile acid permease n=1 Tax=Penicillium chermesinum TaxID=63820 RepID=A0A9W9NSS4_9EURO|nr:ATP-dependent bile acid permease [Penicillium chermesinum]KAJ5225507.1 ATP-dependent bile acid permease [Penicillium chermesinum]
MGGRWFWAFAMMGFLLQQLASVGTNVWIKRWVSEFDNLAEEPPARTQTAGVNSGYYLGVYGLIIGSFALASFIRDITVFSGALKASAQIFDNLLDSILYARLLFFDKVPFGQITNRFSKDVEAMDQEIAPQAMSAFYTFCCLGTVVLVISVLLPVFLPVAVIICLVYSVITRMFINSARDLKRIEAIRQSPLYQQFGEALTGSVSIRAYGHLKRFTDESHHLIDGFNEPNAMRWAVKAWLTLRIASLSAVISWLTGTFLLLGLDRGAVTPGLAGLALTYASTFTDNVLWFVQLYAIVQQSLNSAERIIEYTEITQEPTEPLESGLSTLPPHWPENGSVRFQGYTTSYSLDLDPVLIDVNLSILAGQRAAIVGRTGAGKSSLALALIRVLEADTGSITIDGVNISSISLKRLRQTVSVVPQDPTLFDGSLKENLDPFDKYADAELCDMLRDLQLFRSLQSESLNHSASVLSQGQRQLVCIARALLRRSRVLVLDEATVSIDHDTDALIQSALKTSVAAGTTVITIAHRLSSIADYDTVIVMESGRVVEQGSVMELLSHEGEGAVFRQMCEQSGEIESIRKIAQG